MPAQEFVLARMGQELRCFLETPLGPEMNNGSGPAAMTDAASLGRFRQSGEVHKWMYDRVSLGQLLQQAGFVQIRVCAANESSIPDFNRYQLDILGDGTTRKPDSLFMEATKLQPEGAVSPS